jgi:hypothetical protein
VIYDVFSIEPPDPKHAGALIGRFLETLRAHLEEGYQ